MPPKDRADYETPLILSDNPLRRQDENPADFHFEHFAATLARLIADKRTETPLTIGISGSWGSGKTSLLCRLQRQLDQTRALLDRTRAPALKMDFVNEGENPDQQYRVCRTVWFNAWKYAKEDELLVALVRVILQAMSADDLVSQMMRGLLDPTYPRHDVVNTVLSWFAVKTPVIEFEPNTGEPQPTPFGEKTAMLDLFDEAFDRLLAAWIHHTLYRHQINPRRGVLVVLIDDLDRCLPAQAIQVLEAIKLFLDKPGCVFVLAADVEVICDAVASHYDKIRGQKADDYLEKVIQLRFQLPPVTPPIMQEYLQAQAVDAEMLTQWQTLIAAAEINPRRVKAVVNDIALQWAMLANSGQAHGVQRDEFIRWSALMRAASPTFKKFIAEIDDNPEFRFEIVQKTLQWGCGQADESVRSQFQRFEQDGRRLQKVLRAIGGFSPAFDAQALDAFIHLTAPLPGSAAIDSAGLEKAVRPKAQEEPPHSDARVSGTKGVSGKDRHSSHTYAGIEFMPIPPGKFRMGSSENDNAAYDDEKPQHTVDILYEYHMGKYPLTNAQFHAFVEATGYQTRAEKEGSAYAWNGSKWEELQGADWRHPRGPKSNLEGKDDHPVVCVSWLDALEYCRWLNQVHAKELPKGWRFRLPTEAEWEKAARGELGGLYPWGDETPDEQRCNFGGNVGDTTPVGQYSPQGDSPYGCADMAGNVWEWTHSAFAKYPYEPGDGREKEDPDTRRALRGGSFFNYHGDVRCACRDWNNPGFRDGDLGFRLLASPISVL